MCLVIGKGRRLGRAREEDPLISVIDAQGMCIAIAPGSARVDEKCVIAILCIDRLLLGKCQQGANDKYTSEYNSFHW